MIVVQLDSVAIQWARQKSLPSTTFKKIGVITFVLTFIRTKFYQKFCCIGPNEACTQTDTNSPKVLCVMNNVQKTY
jgi:hypothetical protein